MTRWGPERRYVLGDLLAAQADARPDKVAVYFDDVPVTFGEMHRRSNAAATWLHDFGIRAGDSVVLFTENCPEFVDVWFAAAKIGAVSVPINTAYRGDFLVHQLRDSKARVVVADAALAPRVADIADQCPDLELLLVRDDGNEGPGEVAGIRVGTAGELLVPSGDSLPAGVSAAWNMPGNILYTSGTTGPSKGVVVTQHYLGMAAETIVKSRQITPDEVAFGPVPLFHFSGMLGLVLSGVMAGSTVVLDTRFSVSNTWDRVRRYEATTIILVGSMIVMLWNLPETPEDAELPIEILAGAPIPPELHHAIEKRYGCRTMTMYGMTEAFPLTVMGVADEPVPGSAGKPNPLFDVRIFGDDDTEVEAGQPGEIVCRPLQPHVMFEGYFGKPEATAAQMGNLWFHTGDLARMDEDRNLFFVDRKKDALRRRGENISSFELERSIMGHPAVAEASVYGVPSEFAEDDVMVALVLRPDAEFDHIEFMDFCVERVPFFAVPRYVEVVDDLPRNAVGRILKFRLRERGVTESTWDREKAGYKVSR